MNIKTSKILHTIIFFSKKEKNGNINRLKLMKLIWLADRVHLNKYGRLIIKDTYNALPHGPVPSTAMDISKTDYEGYLKVKEYTISPLKDFDEQYFSKSDLEVLELVWDKFGNLTKYQLRDLSHDFPEWLRYKKDLENKLSPNSYPILIDDFFNEPQVGLFDVGIDKEIISKSMSKYHSVNSIQHYLNNVNTPS